MEHARLHGQFIDQPPAVDGNTKKKQQPPISSRTHHKLQPILGDEVRYTTSEPVVILDIHRGDGPPFFFTVQREDGSEFQTVDQYLVGDKMTKRQTVDYVRQHLGVILDIDYDMYTLTCANGTELVTVDMNVNHKTNKNY